MKKIIFLLLLVEIAYAKTDLKVFAESGKQQEQKVEKNVPTQTKKQSANISEQHAQDVVKLKETLKGLNLVLNNQQAAHSPNRNDLLLKKAFIHVTLVRETGRNRTSATQLTEDEQKHLSVAKDILNKLLQPSAKIAENKKASIYYLLGLISYEYENYQLQQKYFLEALKIDPKGPQAGSLALMVAEQYFDDEKFDDALKFYNGFLSVMNEKQKDLALYKSAWCYISKEDMIRAEVELLKVVQSGRQSGFQKDSLRDLAYIALRHRDELGIIRFGMQKIAKDSDRHDFYSLSLKYFFQMQSRQPLNRLIATVLKNEKKLDVRMDILGHQVNDFRRDYLNPALLSYLQGIRLELEKNKTNLEAPELLGFKKGFQQDLEFFIFNINQAYQATTENDKSNPKSKVGSLLEKVILFYDYFFPESKSKILVYQVLSDLCLDSKSYQCITQIYNKSKNYKPEDKNWTELRSKLRAQQLVFADEMYTKEPAKNEALLVQTFNDFRKDFPNHELVLKGLKRMLQISSQKSDMPAVEKGYFEIYQAEKNPENLYNWTFVLFKQEKYTDVLNAIKDQFPKDEKLNQLRIETHLKMADKESQSDNFQNYEANIIEILKLNKDEQKVTLIYQDWIQKSFNLKSGGPEHALEVYNSMPPKFRLKSNFDAIVLRMAAAFVSMGDFERLKKINLNQYIKPKDTNMVYYKLVNYFSNTDVSLPGWVGMMQSLEADKRSYLLGLLVLVKPEQALDYLRKAKNEPKAAEFYLVALKMHNRTDEFSLTPTDKKILGKLADGLKKSYSKESSPLVAQIKQVKFPTSKMSFQKYNAIVEKLVPTVKEIRAKILKEFKDVSIERKLLIIPEAEILEAKTAKAIEEAPLPPGLNEVQKADYRAGINELAKEFVEQSVEYRKMYDGLSEKMIDITKQKAQEILPDIDITKWPWPDKAQAKKAVTLQSQSPVQAHFYLDAQMADKTLDDNEYETTRVGLLAMSQNSDVMREYIRQELQQQNKEEILKKWRSLAPAAKEESK